MPQRQKITLTITLLSPVHIGDGNGLNSFDYIVQFKTKTLTCIDLNRFYQRLNPDGQEFFKKYSEQPEKSIENMRNLINAFYSKHPDHFKSAVRYQASCSDAFLHEYKNKLNSSGNEFNKLEIKTFCKTRFSPYIPGSTIKGALRTAIVHKFAEQQPYQDEKRLLGYSSPLDDPFQKLLVRDTQAIAPAQLCVEHLIRPSIKEKGGKSAIPIYAETLKSGSTLTCEIILKKGFVFDSFEEVHSACQNFYKSVSKEQQLSFKYSFPNEMTQPESPTLKNSFLLNIGFGGGISAKRAFNATDRKNLKIFKPAKTQWITANTKKSLGWCFCTIKEIRS